MLERILDQYYEEEFLKMDGFDDAIIGVEENNMRLIYSVSKCLEILERDMEPSDAKNHFNFNIAGAHVGEKTPILCWDTV